MHIAHENQSFCIELTCLTRTTSVSEHVGITKWCATGAQKQRWHEKEEHFKCKFFGSHRGDEHETLLSRCDRTLLEVTDLKGVTGDVNLQKFG